MRKGLSRMKNRHSLLKLTEGTRRWSHCLGSAFWVRLLVRLWHPKPACPPAPSPALPEPQTEAERALYQAMGWKENGWEE